MAWMFVYRDLLRGRPNYSLGNGVPDVNEYHERKLRGRVEFRVSFEIWENDHHRSYSIDRNSSPYLVESLRDIIEHKLDTVMNSEDLVVSLTEVEYLGKSVELHVATSVPKAKEGDSNVGL